MSVDGFVLDYRPNGKEAVVEAYRRYQSVLASTPDPENPNPVYLAGIELGEHVAADLKQRIKSEGRSPESITWSELCDTIEGYWKGAKSGKISDKDYDSSVVMWNVLTCFWEYGMHVCLLKAHAAAEKAEQVERNSGVDSKIAKEWRRKELRWVDLASPDVRGKALMEIWKTA